MQSSLISFSAAAIALMVLGAAGTARADVIAPDIATQTPTVDRFPAASFGDVGTFMGRTDVLGIGILGSQRQTNSFDNKQGSAYALSGPASDTLSMDLWVPTSYDTTSGTVETGMWGVMLNSANAVKGYPIIGFQNTGTTAGFEAWDDQNGGYQALSATVNYGAWNTLAFNFDGTDYNYFVNGALVDSIAGDSSVTDYSEVIFNSVNSGADYRVHWSNTPASVPEPSSLPILGSGLAIMGLFGFVGMRRRNSSSFLSAA